MVWFSIRWGERVLVYGTAIRGGFETDIVDGSTHGGGIPTTGAVIYATDPFSTFSDRAYAGIFPFTKA